MARKRKPERDHDVIDDGRVVRVLRRTGEKQEEYEERLLAAAPPLSEPQRNTIRAAAREYWDIIRNDRRKRERRRRERRRMVLRVAVERREGERRIADRRAS